MTTETNETSSYTQRCIDFLGDDYDEEDKTVVIAHWKHMTQLINEYISNKAPNVQMRNEF